MKKTLIALLASLGVAAAIAEEISLTQAETAVGNWIAHGGGFGRLSGCAKVSGETFEDPDTGARMHLVRLPGKGFVVTSADDGIEPIMMFSDGGDGEFVAEEGNPVWDLLRWDLAARAAALMEAEEASGPGGARRAAAAASAGDGAGEARDAIAAEADAARGKWAALLPGGNGLRRAALSQYYVCLSDERRAPFLQTSWNQTEGSWGAVYNLYTPGKLEVTPAPQVASAPDPEGWVRDALVTNELGHYPVGCVAVAGGQLMRYWEYPKSASPKTVTCRVDGVERDLEFVGSYVANGTRLDDYRWDFMGFTEPLTGIGSEAVSRLLSDIGVTCGAWYTASGTAMSLYTLTSELKSTFSYRNAAYHTGNRSGTGLQEVVVPNLDAKCPILMGIGGAHAVIADGYGYARTDGLAVGLPGSTFYLHVNLGWGYHSHYWYAPPNINKYSTIDEIVCNVFPDRAGSILSGRVVGPHGRPVYMMNVLYNGTTHGANQTDGKGIYSFILPAGSYSVWAQDANGTATASQSVTLGTMTTSANGNRIVNITATSVATVLSINSSTFVVNSGASSPDASAARAAAAAGTTFSSPFRVSLSCATSGAEIRYTLDGTQPTLDSALYDGPITIQDTTTLCAVAFAEGMECSETFEQTWTFEDPVSRDNFANARPISGASGQTSFDNTGYTKETGEPTHSSNGSAGGTSAWAVWTAPESGDWTFRLSGVIAGLGEDMDTQLAVYTGSSVDALTRVAANDNVNSFDDDYSSRVSFAARKGTSYYIAMDSYNGRTYPGTLTLRWEEGFVHYAQFAYGTMFAPVSGGDAGIGVSSSTDWHVAECSDWIVPDTATGTNGATLSFSIAANATGRERTGFLTVQAGNSDLMSLTVRQHSMDFVTTREEAVEAAWRENRRILLVWGRETCGNTTATLFSSIPSATVRSLVESGYILWYSNCDRQRDASGYAAGGYLPTVAILDPLDMSSSVAGVSGYQSASALKSLLDANAAWGGLAAPTEVTLSGVGTVMSATPFSMAATFADGTVLDMKHGATWSIASGSAATISKTGVLAPVSGRTGIVTVSGSVVLRGQAYTRTMSVRIVDPATVTGISLSGPDTIDLYDEVGGRFTATATFGDGMTAVIAPNWTVEETAVTNAAISADGLVTFPNPEKYTKASRLRVTAECNGVSASKEADVWGWSVSLSSWTTPQRVVWPGQTLTVVPQTVTWWRHGVTEEPTTDLGGVAFRSEYGWVNGAYFSFSGATSDAGGIQLTIPSGKSNAEGYVELCLVAEATRLGRTSSKYCYPYFKYLPSAPAQTVTVTFVANGGEPATQTSKYAVGYTYGYLPEAARKGYSCSWYTAVEGGTRVTTSSNCLASVTRLYAHWSPRYYYIYYNANGGAGSMYSTTCYYDSPANLRANTFTKEGAMFAGWATSPDGPVAYQDGEEILNLSSVYTEIPLYAVWVENGYKVVFDPNGGTGEMTPQMCQVGTRSSLKPAAFARRGATFAGWSRTPGGAVEFSDRSEVCDLATTCGETVTLYAVWNLPAVKTIELAGPGAIDLYDVDSAQFTAVCRLANGAVVDVAPKWTIEETAVTNAAISADGLVTFPDPTKYTKASKLKVTAECNGVSASKEADVWGWSVSLSSWTTPQRVVWPGQILKIIPQTVTWWRHGVTEEPTTDLGGVDFLCEYGWINGTYFSFNGATSNKDGIELTIPSGKSDAEGRVELCLVAEATRLGRTSSKYFYPYFKYLPSAPAQTVTVTFVADGGEPATQTSKYAVGYTYGYLPEAARKGYSCSWYTAVEGGTPISTSSNCLASVTRLHARWSPRYYYIQYNANGGKGSMYGSYFYYDEPANLRANTFAKEGAMFAGWATSPDGPVVYQDGEEILNLSSVYAEIPLYAVWSTDFYSVAFNANGGTGTMANQTVALGASITLPGSSFTRTGHTFAGWAETPDGAVKYASGAQVCDLASSPGTTVTLYAVWTGNTYTVTLNRQNGTGGSSSATATYGAAMPEIIIPTRTGYTFGGYYTSTGGGGTQYYTSTGASARDWDKTSAATLYAKWTIRTCTVTLDRQNGTGGFASTTATYGAAMPSITVPTRTGYTFGGYWTAANGGGTQYYTSSGASARSWVIDGDATLYAKWIANTYKVTLDRQNGTGGSSSATATYGAAMPEIIIPTRTGYTFGGYWTAADGGGTQYYTAAGASAHNWDKAAATTLYAKWIANTYKVTLDRQNGTGGSASTTATYGAAMPEIIIPTRTGYTFGGYYTSTGGGGTQYYTATGVSAHNWDKAAATTLYAKWTASTYAVTLDRQSGTGGSASTTATYGAAMPAITVPTRTGYAFGGYWTAANGGGTQYYTSSGASARSWVIDGDATLYAKWTASTYTVTLDRQNGTGGSASTTATYGAAMPAITFPTRTGYTFGGYFTAANGGGTQYYTASGVSAHNWDKAAATTLYAKWTGNTYEVTFDTQSGTGGMASATATYGAAMPSITVPTRTGYTFGGYWTAANGGGTQYYTSSGASARNWDRTSATTLYAFWTKALPLPVYRFYSKNYKGHFFTIDEVEKDGLIAGNPNWKFEGAAYRAYTNNAPKTVALYRFYSKGYRGHFFTIDADEAETVKTNPNWKYEGIAYYVYPSEVEGSVPVFRFWSKGYRHHFYTTNEEEKDNLIATNPNWKFEGTAFWALPAEEARSAAKAAAMSNDRNDEDNDENDEIATNATNAISAINGDANGFSSGNCASPVEGSGVVGPWSLAAWPDCEPVAPEGVTAVGGLVVETRADAPELEDLPGRDGSTSRPLGVDASLTGALPLLLALPDGSWRATLRSAVGGAVADEDATGVFGFTLPANGAWHWLRVRDTGDAAADAFSLWLRAE